jgi:hypothetical protein
MAGHVWRRGRREGRVLHAEVFGVEGDSGGDRGTGKDNVVKGFDRCERFCGCGHGELGCKNGVECFAGELGIDV